MLLFRKIFVQPKKEYIGGVQWDVLEREYIEGLALEDPLIDYGVKNEGFPTSPFYPHPYHRHKGCNFFHIVQNEGGGGQTHV